MCLSRCHVTTPKLFSLRKILSPKRKFQKIHWFFKIFPYCFFWAFSFIVSCTKIYIPHILSFPKKSNIGETPNLSTDADRSTNIFQLENNKIKSNPERLHVFKALRVGPQMHQSTSQTHPRRGPTTGAIWNNSSFLRLFKSIYECTSPLVEHLPCVDNPCMQSKTTPCFQGSTSWLMSALVHWLNTSHAWTIHICNPEQLLVLGFYKLVYECTSPPVEHLPRVDDPQPVAEEASLGITIHLTELALK